MKTVLVPHDFSPAAENALHYAVGLAGHLSARLVLLNVSLYPIVSPEMSVTAFSFEDMRQDALLALRELSQRVRSAHPTLLVECRSEIGELSGSIRDQAARESADLVLMGITRQENALMKLLVGSNALDAAKGLCCPLMVVPESARYNQVRQLAYASDYDPAAESSAVLQRIRYFSELFGALLHVVHVVPEGHALSPKEAAVDNHIEQALQHTQHRTHVIHDSNVAKGLLDFTVTNWIDILIAEPRKHGLFHSSITKELAYSTPVPLLLLRADQISYSMC